MIINSKKIIFILLLPALVFGCTTNQNNKQTEISYQNIEKHVKELSSDKYQGRAPMSVTEPLVTAYISQQLKEKGLVGANNGSFFQDVPVMAVTSKISATLDFKTPSGRLSFDKLTEYVSFTQKVKDGIKLEDSEVIFCGFGIVAPEYGRNDFADVDVKGKTIVIFVNDPGYGTTGEYFKGNTMTWYGRWPYKFEEAARQGAKACFIVHETGQAGYPWKVVRNNGETTKYFLKSDDGYQNRCDIEGWISTDSAEKLFKACGQSFSDLKQRAISRGFKPFSLKSTASASIQNKYSYGTSQNVCGLIKGSTNPDEVIVYTAHWDHLGIGDVIHGDSIYNGATDNASAVSWLIEIAGAFKIGNQPKRSVLFLSVTGEESGLLGSSYYCENPFFPMKKTVAVINTDVILFLGKFRDVNLTGFGHSELDDWVATEAQKQGRYISPDPNPENGMFFRSDQFPFVKKGVPAIFAKGFTDAVKYGKDKTAKIIANYWAKTYHTPFDEYVPGRDDLQGLVDDANLFYEVGFNLASSGEWPKWSVGSEFKR